MEVAAAPDDTTNHDAAGATPAPVRVHSHPPEAVEAAAPGVMGKGDGGAEEAHESGRLRKAAPGNGPALFLPGSAGDDDRRKAAGPS